MLNVENHCPDSKFHESLDNLMSIPSDLKALTDKLEELLHVGLGGNYF